MGGSGLGRLDAAVIFEAMATGDVPLSHSAGSVLICLSASRLRQYHRLSNHPQHVVCSMCVCVCVCVCLMLLVNGVRHHNAFIRSHVLHVLIP